MVEYILMKINKIRAYKNVEAAREGALFLK